MKTSLIILNRNEIDGLKVILPKIPFETIDEVVAIDGQSTDGSLEFLHEKGIRVVYQEKLGRGNAIIQGVKETTGELIIFLSVDGNEDPADIPKLIEKLKDADVAIASRFMKGAASDDSDDPLLIRKLGNYFFTFMVNVIWNANVTDAINGLRGIRRTAWNTLGVDSPYHETEFQMTIRAAKLGMKIAEIPTIEGGRIGGNRYASTTKMGWTFTKFLLREIWMGNSFATRTYDMKRAVRTHYDGIATFYEHRKRKFYLNMLRDSVTHFKGHRIIDLGCGTGLALSWFDGSRVGVELSSGLLRRAHSGPEYVVADVEYVPFKDGAFDLALCLDVIEHVPSLKIVDEAHRILSNGGTFLVSTAHKKYGIILEILEKLRLKLPEGPHGWRSPEEITGKMVNVGFQCTQWSKAFISFCKGLKPGTMYNTADDSLSETSQHGPQKA